MRRSHPSRALRSLAFSVSTALLFCYDGQHFKNITAAPVRTVAVNGLLSF